VTYITQRSLHLVASHQVHGIITGLAPLRTIESTVDGLDRLLVSFKDAKVHSIALPRADDVDGHLGVARRRHCNSVIAHLRASYTNDRW
jgi:hypothetical protein